jgi:hypothetical protein
MIQTYRPLDPSTADEFQQAAKVLWHGHGVDGPGRPAIVLCRHRGSERVGRQGNS